MDFSLINKEYIRTHAFSVDGLHFAAEDHDVSYRLHKDDDLPTTIESNRIALRKEFVRIFHSHFDGNFAKLEVRTGINESTMRKYLRGNLSNKGRNITREAVAKLCVGIPLPVEESNKLFILQGHSLEPEHGLFDAIVVDALQCGDDIQNFYETCGEFGIKIS